MRRTTLRRISARRLEETSLYHYRRTLIARSGWRSTASAKTPRSGKAAPCNSAMGPRSFRSRLKFTTKTSAAAPTSSINSTGWRWRPTRTAGLRTIKHGGARRVTSSIIDDHDKGRNRANLRAPARQMANFVERRALRFFPTGASNRNEWRRSRVFPFWARPLIDIRRAERGRWAGARPRRRTTVAKVEAQGCLGACRENRLTLPRHNIQVCP